MSHSEKSGCAALLASLFGAAPKPTPNLSGPLETETVAVFPYRLTQNFLSPAEANFYHVLRQVVGETVTICPKVSLGDLFYAQTGDRAENQRQRNRIDRKHVDFLVCDSHSMRPLLGIELDDGSHRQAARQERDEFVERVFAAAGLPLFRQPVQHSYHVGQLEAAVRPYLPLPPEMTLPERPVAGLAVTPVPEPRHFDEPGPATPACPRCGQPMVLRTVKKAGPAYGRQFWGCPDYPRCQGMRPVARSIVTAE